MSAYSEVVERFAKLGATIYQTDPREHYVSIGRLAQRPLEPGFIPVDKPARVVTVSFYPNASELPSSEYHPAEDEDVISKLRDALRRSSEP